LLHLCISKGHRWNHRRGHRIYCSLEPNLQIKPHKRLEQEKPNALAVPMALDMTVLLCQSATIHFSASMPTGGSHIINAHARSKLDESRRDTR
jgi:hypothetical protein